MAGAYIKNENSYIDMGDCFLCYTNNKEEFFISKCDYEKVKPFCWRLSKNGYIITNIRIGDKRYSVEIHRLIINNYPYNKDRKDYVIDHTNKNKRDNRRENLRKTTNCKNSSNSNLSTNNTSGYIGVSWNKKNNNWVAYIKVNWKHIHLGSFNDKNDAIIERLKAEKIFFGSEYAPQRHLFEKYNV